MPKYSREEVLKRLRSDDGFIVGEGYLFEFEQRGYLRAGCFVPEVVLEHPELVKGVHREFARAGSDVVLAFTYYAHREKMRLIGREDDLEKINLLALKIAREVADETNTLMAGNICNSTVHNPDDPKILKEIANNCKEQVEWAVKGNADFIVAETFGSYGEAKIALDAILKYGQGLPAVVTLRPDANDEKENIVDTVVQLAKDGADVVGFNCGGGPKTILKVAKEVQKRVDVPVAALPVTYRTDDEHPVFEALNDIDNPGRSAFPVDLDAWLCTVTQIREFARECFDNGIRYIGLCCGSRAHYLRALAEEVGRKTEASRFSPDMTQHYSRLKDGRTDWVRGKFEEKYKTK